MPESDTIAQLNSSLSGRYVIERELGRGGMATVYLARDVRHDRLVAIKVLRPDLSAALGAERFLREINLTAGLTHPRIVALYDSGAVGELLYYVMPHVAGESLRDRLDREGQLPIGDAVVIATAVGAALSYAHAHGVVHRDIKPENILLADGEVTVADFGIGRAIAATRDERLTQTGLSLGSPAYMSPEQAAGEPNIDGRSDIFSLGCVLYEMLVGEPPFRAPTAQATIARLASQPMPSIHQVRAAVPVAIENAVRQALEKVPADRFPTAASFSDALRNALAEPLTTAAGDRASRRPWPRIWVAAAAVIIAGAAIGGYALLHRTTSRGIAILAFRNVGGDTANEAFSDGMSEEVTTALQRTGGLNVAPRASAFFFKNKPVSEQEIGKKLGVDYVLNGQVRPGGRRRRVQVQLIDVASGVARWDGSYESDLDANNPFAVQDSISLAIVRELRVHLSSTASPTKRATESSEAHDLYLSGRYFLEKRDAASLQKAQDYFTQAIAKDAFYARAWAGLSGAYALRSLAGGAALSEMHAEAKRAARRALELDPDLVEAHTALGFVLLFFDWNAPDAAREFDRALTLDPSYAPAHLFRAVYFAAIGQANGAVKEAKEAVRLEPFSLVNNVRLATYEDFAHDYQSALDQAHKVADLEATFWQWRSEAVRAHVQLGQCDSALALVSRSGTLWSVPGMGGWPLARCGRPAGALTELDRLRSEVKQGHFIFHADFAAIYAGLEDQTKAFAELDSAVADREWWMIYLSLEPEYDNLHADPRFARLLQRIGLAR